MQTEKLLYFFANNVLPIQKESLYLHPQTRNKLSQAQTEMFEMLAHSSIG